jgi:hypothetical protein
MENIISFISKAVVYPKIAKQDKNALDLLVSIDIHKINLL